MEIMTSTANFSSSELGRANVLLFDAAVSWKDQHIHDQIKQSRQPDKTQSQVSLTWKMTRRSQLLLRLHRVSTLEPEKRRIFVYSNC